MASFIAAVLAFTASLILTTMADKCDGYKDLFGNYQPPKECGTMYCCGKCESRYSEFSTTHLAAPIAFGVLIPFFTIITIIIICCNYPCCCLYKMCRKPTSVVATTTTTVVTQFPQQQPPNPAAQNPPHQPISSISQPGYPVQPGYGTPAPYQGQPYAPGPPPPYQESGGYPSPYSQAAYVAIQPPYPLNLPVQAGYAHPPPQPDSNNAQPPYNPADIEPPKTEY
ncbi:protein shisa-5-like [Clarias gariepinus]|uniref:protein shisa-5-like n=1 Tax=Clarias gariepinus TaxID=13013 RepID=UPI00234CD6DC|nr:protein shisa-5-like [Clarias gariepinus]